MLHASSKPCCVYVLFFYGFGPMCFQLSAVWADESAQSSNQSLCVSVMSVSVEGGGGEGGLPPWSCLWFKKKIRNASWNKIRIQTCSYSLKAGNDKAAAREPVCVLCLCGGHSAFFPKKRLILYRTEISGNYIKQAQEVTVHRIPAQTLLS